MGSDPAQLFANHLFFYKSKWLKLIKSANFGTAIKFDNIFWLIDHLIAINVRNKFEDL